MDGGREARRNTGDDMQQRAQDATVEALMFGILRETRDDVKKLVDRFDDLAEARRKEAYTTGSFKADLESIKERERFTRGLAGTALVGVIVGYIIKLMGK